MTARATFGRKGVSDGGDGGDGATQSRRAAFLATERERADRAADRATAPPRRVPARRVDFAKERVAVEPQSRAAAPRRPVGPRSLKLAYALWLVLGIAGIHRLYLGRTASGALQSLVCAGCFAATLMQYYQAFAGLAICWLIMFADGLKLKQMHADAVGSAGTATAAAIAA